MLQLNENQKDKDKKIEMPHHDKLQELATNYKDLKIQNIEETQKLLGISDAKILRRFTLDEHYTKSMNRAFFRLWKNQALYRKFEVSKYCPTLKSLVPDEIIELKKFSAGEATYTIPGHGEKDRKVTVGIRHFVAFPLVDSSHDETNAIEVPITRAEFLLGTVALGVHPDDEKYASYINKYVIHPLTNVEIPIFQDYSAKIKGGGPYQPKIITPVHSQQDFDLLKKFKRDKDENALISFLDPMGKISFSDTEDREAIIELHKTDFEGMDRFEAQEKILKLLEKIGAYRGYEDHETVLEICKITGDVIEDHAYDQWVFESERYAKALLDLLFGDESDDPDVRAAFEQRKRSKDFEINLTITPESRKRELKEWLENVKDWNISHQSWWGRRLPVYELISVDDGELVGPEIKFKNFMKAKGAGQDDAWKNRLRTIWYKNMDPEIWRKNLFDPKVKWRNVHKPRQMHVDKTYSYYLSDLFFQPNSEPWFPGESLHEAKKQAIDALFQSPANRGFKHAKHRAHPMDHLEMIQDLDHFDSTFVQALHSFTALGWPTHQENDDGLLAPFKRRHPQDIKTFLGKDFTTKAGKELIMSLALTNRLPSSKFLVYNDIVDQENNQSFSVKNNGLFIEPSNVIMGAELEDLSEEIESSSEIDEDAKSVMMKKLEKSFPEGLESASADALRLTLLGGKIPFGDAEKNWVRVLKNK